MTVLAPLVKRIEVGCTRERAFQVFTEEIHLWWPVEGHSLGEDKVDKVVLEPGPGGRILERWHDGTECSWGEMSVWDPPRRIAFSWLPNPETGGTTQVEVSFEPHGQGTVVTLEHRGWEAEYDDVEERHAGYDTGWDRLLLLYKRSAEKDA
jgi:uncharacterized protein YndB with AHSA1/START domain